MKTPISLLFDRALEQQRLRPLDVAFARFLAERDTQLAPALLWLAAVLSRQLADGHLCLDLDLLPALAQEQDWPEDWRALADTLRDDDTLHLPVSPLLAANSDGAPADAPLVLDGTRLYLRRYWNHERNVAQGILDRVACDEAPAAHFADELAQLFPAEAVSPDWQRVACALAARGAFGVVTGGPGTGKTTTVVRLLGLLQTLQLREHGQALRIRLAAPTGKAAARLNASIAAQLAQLDVDDAVRAAIPSEVLTLHRLLGARPDTRRYRHDRRNPLHLDVLVIDEASMVDLEMLAAVLDALPASARLVLLGDKDQLSSVEAGAVLGDLCRRAEAGHYDEATARWIAAATGDDIAAFVQADAQPLDQRIAMLRESHRFGAASGIGRLAQAVNAGDAPAALALLQAPAPDLAWQRGVDASALAALAIDGSSTPDGGDACGYRHYLEWLRAHRPAGDAGEATHADWARGALQAFNRFQLLCALRRGPHGVDGLNRQIATALRTRGLIDGGHALDHPDWYEGRPVLLTRNDYSLGLMNGDVGLCLRLPAAGNDGTRLLVAFLATGTNRESGERLRFVPPSRLADAETAWALTVHKSQGSEFEHTALLLPPDPGGTAFDSMLSRELLYTAITRARRRFSLVGSAAIVEQAIAHRTQRHSGLAARLAPHPAAP
ncbi:exodeoxyribonuclease V subunit alpha [Rhodanobacter sp. DHB23]|uniref:exodeoxyribonuclease V subunit alpha n=1 Tax=Rhodanobacter sp. DHB23 TaxID=2775923 RepID=UPI001782719D|nr:exodeoxyribonuclease V subunit alpha [Rhodanobacter sp. DHB23]MBD8872872.1 exodeoxyribonuclease V subunit alpha [Rhodanobacter sp. DHB23]